MAEEVKAGMKSPGVTTGPIDPVKARVAKIAMGAGGLGMNSRDRSAGMLLDTVQTTQPYHSGYAMDTYRNSYASGFNQASGTYDIPTYFVQMNEQNGGLLYWPVTIKEKYSWYRYWARSDAYVGRSLELLADLPMSKLNLTMPKMPKGKESLRDEILEFYEWQSEELGMFELLQSVLWEMNMIGNVHVFHEWSDEKKMWTRAIVLPPEEISVFQYPFTDKKRVEYRPERLIQLISGSMEQGGSAVPLGGCDRDGLSDEIVKNIPDDIVDMVKKDGCIVMDSDPSTGSFVHHIARRRSPYLDLGASVLERVLVPMLQKEHFRYTQLSLASRNMTPKNIVSAEGLLSDELDDLRTQVDLSYLDPEYTIVTNYPVTWEQIGAQDRLLQIDQEYERIENQVFAALGVTRELLTGEGSFSGNKITVEILNTMFLLTREVLKEYVERQLFRPIAEARGWFEEKKNGVKKYWYPTVGFNRLTIRDNAEVFDSLFQLYQKGSLPVDVILELFNLNPDQINEQLEEDLFTVKDATFNRLAEEVHSEVGRALVEQTNIVEMVAKKLGLEITQAAEDEEGGGGFGSFDEFGGGQVEEPSETAPDGGTVEETADPGGNGAVDHDALADEVLSGLPDGATDEQIQEAVGQL